MKDPFNTSGKAVYEIRGFRRCLIRMAVRLLQLYFATLRTRPTESATAAIRNCPQPKIFLVWHNRSLIALELFRRYFEPKRIACLISPSKAAAWEAAVFEELGFKVVRGSSSRRGIQAAREMVRTLRSGNDVGISPDGPSGPLFSFQRGALALGQLSGAPYLALNANCSTALRLPCWDRHLIPLPFSRLEVCAEVIPTDTIDFRNETVAMDSLRSVCLRQLHKSERDLQPLSPFENRL